MKVMFLDESGDHQLKRINTGYPIFALGGVIVDRAYVRDVIEPQMAAFKRKYIGNKTIILHTVDMNDGTGDYAFLSDPVVRASFYADLNALVQNWEYTVVCCVIDKRRYVAKYADPADLYHYSLVVLVERFCWELGTELDTGFICAEKRGNPFDRDLMLAWERIRTSGTAYASAKRIDDRIVGLDLRDKKPNLAGLQLADLVVTPIGRHVAGTPPKPNRVQWEVVESKMRRVGKSNIGSGLVILP